MMHGYSPFCDVFVAMSLSDEADVESIDFQGSAGDLDWERGPWTAMFHANVCSNFHFGVFVSGRTSKNARTGQESWVEIFAERRNVHRKKERFFFGKIFLYLRIFFEYL